MERQLVAEDHFGLVSLIAQKYTTLRPGEAIEDTEEFADGSVGLTTALKDFEPERGFKFSTPAWRYITNAILTGKRRREKRKVFYSCQQLGE